MHFLKYDYLHILTVYSERRFNVPVVMYKSLSHRETQFSSASIALWWGKEWSEQEMGRDMWPSFAGMLELGALKRICTLQRIHKDRQLKNMAEK